MRHLDEGTLQTWLDLPHSGLDEAEQAEIRRHLAGCEVCSARLDALRQSSLDVRDLLSAPLLDAGEVPAFQEVLARAGHDGAAGARPPGADDPRRWSRMGWAASIVAAAGLGWLANDLLTPLGAPMPMPQAATSSSRPPETQAGERSLVAELPAPPLPTGQDPEGVQTMLTAEVPALTAFNEREATWEEVTAVVQPPALEPGAAAARPALVPLRRRVTPEEAVAFAYESAEAPPDSLGVSPDAPARVRVTGTVADDRGRPLEQAQVFVEGTSTGTLANDEGRFMFWLDARAADPVTGAFTVLAERLGYASGRRTLTLGGADSLTVEFSLPETALALEELVVTAEAGAVMRRARPDSTQGTRAARGAPGEFLWRTLSVDEAEAVAGFAPVLVAGLDLVSVGVSDQDGGTWVRVRQTLANGDTLELLEALAADPESIGVDAGRTRVVVKHGDVTVVALARLTEAELGELLGRLR